VKILALIPARGGSKRLPGKNIRILQEKPLIVWSIEVAKGIPEICDILVSTNDLAILSVCKEAGALVPWLRPASLATDEASSIDVAIHALDWYESEKGAIDGVMLLQPTSPFRSKQSWMVFFSFRGFGYSNFVIFFLDFIPTMNTRSLF
jgi:CMP-N-acetylneuraminic acid synthetase